MLEAHRRLARTQHRQHGAFTRKQARLAGLSSTTIDRHIRSGLFVVRFKGAYVDASVARTPLQDAMAACLACGDGAVVSRGTAAGAVWGVDIVLPALPHVTIPARRRVDIEGIEVHRSRSLGKLDVTRHQLIPVTSPMRTACDVAETEHPDVVERVVDGFWVRRLLDPARLLRYLDTPARRSRPGADVLRELLAPRLNTKASDSELERMYFRILLDAGLPLPQRQYPVRTRRGMRYLDYAYPDAMVAVELDGFEGRTVDRERFQDERRRQNALVLVGWSFLRFTKGDLVEAPWQVAFDTGTAIGLRPARWRPIAPPGARATTTRRTR